MDGDHDVVSYTVILPEEKPAARREPEGEKERAVMREEGSGRVCEGWMVGLEVEVEVEDVV